MKLITILGAIAIGALVAFSYCVSHADTISTAKHVSLQIDKVQKLMAYDSSGNLQYIGTADIGVDTDEPGWLIQKILYDQSGNLVAVQFADNDPSFKKVWDNRGSYTYAGE